MFSYVQVHPPLKWKQYISHCETAFCVVVSTVSTLKKYSMAWPCGHVLTDGCSTGSLSLCQLVPLFQGYLTLDRVKAHLLKRDKNS